MRGRALRTVGAGISRPQWRLQARGVSEHAEGVNVYKGAERLPWGILRMFCLRSCFLGSLVSSEELPLLINPVSCPRHGPSWRESSSGLASPLSRQGGFNSEGPCPLVPSLHSKLSGPLGTALWLHLEARALLCAALYTHLTKRRSPPRRAGSLCT